MATTGTAREIAKAQRRAAIVTAAAKLFADHGFAAVTLEDLGSAVGVSGPAVYRHFSGKQAILDELLVGVSERLYVGGSAVLADQPDPAAAIRALVRFHVAFALSSPDTIRVQDRDIAELSRDALDAVRSQQRAYIELWVGAIAPLVDEPASHRRLRVRAAFGLINSTPHSARSRGLSSDDAARILSDMAVAALTQS